jgi:autoinducer 2-degrading protein
LDPAHHDQPGDDERRVLFLQIAHEAMHAARRVRPLHRSWPVRTLQHHDPASVITGILLSETHSAREESVPKEARMFVVCVTVTVHAEDAAAFLEATLENARATRSEPGNVRFDVLRAIDSPNRFFFYEAYTSEDGLRAHQQTAHYLAWRERVASMMAEPRVGVKHLSVLPDPWT